MIKLANTDLTLYPLCLGGNVFGYSADKENSEAVLSFYADNGGNFIDTADMYSQWAPGHIGGESERAGFLNYVAEGSKQAELQR
ncbi:MAG: hypothetical protein EB009_06015 [Actinobacteria bacterium]|nr:hypothetical protein [Actinomycetota bacterium]